MSTSTLRKELHIMTANYSIKDHPDCLQEISKRHPNSVDIIDCDIPMDCRCLSHALGLARVKNYVKAQRSSVVFTGIEFFAGKEFIEWLLKKDLLGEIKRSDVRLNDVVLYFNDNEWTHAGRMKDCDTVVSKWGEGLLYEHGIFETPENYGSDVRFFKEVIPDFAYTMFSDYVVERMNENGLGDCDQWLSECNMIHNDV